MNLWLSEAGPNINLQVYKIMEGKSSFNVLMWLLSKQTGHGGGRLIPLSLAKNIFYLLVLEANVHTHIHTHVHTRACTHTHTQMQELVMRNFTVSQILLSNC